MESQSVAGFKLIDEWRLESSRQTFPFVCFFRFCVCSSARAAFAVVVVSANMLVLNCSQMIILALATWAKLWAETAFRKVQNAC